MLAPLGADIRGSQFLDPDGSFPNHIPNPEHPSAMAAGAQATTAAGADLGIVFDTDVDRYRPLRAIVPLVSCTSHEATHSTACACPVLKTSSAGMTA